MREEVEDRLKRLRTRKGELLKEMRGLNKSSAKWEVKNDEVLLITGKIMELK